MFVLNLPIPFIIDLLGALLLLNLVKDGMLSESILLYLASMGVLQRALGSL